MWKKLQLSKLYLQYIIFYHDLHKTYLLQRCKFYEKKLNKIVKDTIITRPYCTTVNSNLIQFQKMICLHVDCNRTWFPLNGVVNPM